MKARISICFLIAIITIGYLYPVNMVYAAPSCSFYITASTERVKKGEDLTVCVSGKDIKELSAYEIRLSFDSKLLKFVKAISAIEGYSALIPPKDNGDVVRFATAKFKDKPTEKGDMTLCTLTFESLAAGDAKVTLQSVKMMDKILTATECTVEKTVTIPIGANPSTPDSSHSGINATDSTVPGINITDVSVPGNPAGMYKDVPVNAWYSKAVYYLVERGIISGLGDGMFTPELAITRADFLIMVIQSYNIAPDQVISNNFADAGKKYYTPYLATAKRLGLVIGIGNNQFAPEKNINRQDMLVMLYRVLEKYAKLPKVTGGKKIESFTDTRDIAGYAKEAVKFFVETGIFQGDGVNLSPKASTTRAQAAQVLYNLLTK